MSPTLDTSLERREAVSALLVMLAAVMGLGSLPESVEADEPMDDYRLNGVFNGFFQREPVSARMRLFHEDGTIRLEIGPLGRNDIEPYRLEFDARASRQFVDGLRLGFEHASAHGPGDGAAAAMAVPALVATELDGAFLGYIDGNQIAADLQLSVAAGVTRATLRRLGSGREPVVIETKSPDVARFVAQMTGRQVELMAAGKT